MVQFWGGGNSGTKRTSQPSANSCLCSALLIRVEAGIETEVEAEAEAEAEAEVEVEVEAEAEAEEAEVVAMGCEMSTTNG